MQTTKDPRAIAAVLEPHVNNLLVAMAFAQLERQRVGAIQRAELQSHPYHGKNLDGRTVRVTEPKDAWMIEEENLSRYFARLNEIHLASGFAAAAEGHCPALTAESSQFEAEQQLIGAARQFFGVTSDQLVHGQDTRQRYLDLLIKLVVNRSGYSSPQLA